jgi:hypothetical protein
MAAVTKVGDLSLSDSTKGSHKIQLLQKDCDTSILHILMLMTPPLTASAAPQEEQAFNSDGIELTTKLHKQDVSSTDHTYELTDDDYDDEDGSHFYDDLGFGSGKKIHQQQKLCVSSCGSPAGGPTARKRGSCLGTSADTTPLDKILGSLESMLPKYIRDSGRVCDILTHPQEEPQQQQTARRDHRKKILDIDRLITQCYGHLLSSDGEGDYYHHDEENGGDQGDASQPARHLESIKIDIDRVISKCGLLSAVGDDEKMKRMTEDIPDIMRVSRENCNATLYDSLRSLETFLPSYHADCQY